MPKLVIISFSKATGEAIYKQLCTLLYPRLEITYYYLNSLPPKNLTADLIIYSSTYAFKQLSQYISPDISYLLVRRSINYHEINPLFNLPKGTNALLVNDTKESCYQTILLLQTIGIDHINFYPYYPGATDFPKLHTAITPGEPQFIPSFVTNIIDIKTRLVDITSIIEILNHFNLLDDFSDIISAKYVHDIINLTKTSNNLLRDNNIIKERFKAIINTVHDGLIAINSENKISLFNPIAEQLFEQQADNILGKDIAEVFDKKLMLATKNTHSEGLVKLFAHDIVISETPLNKGRLYVLKDVSEIHRLEESVRRRLYQEQNIARYTFENFVGKSPALLKTLSLAKKMAKSNSTVFIQGESGTGKELLAQSIHNASNRASGPFVAINFAALSETLLESELFGYVEGSFTGARRGGAPGLFEAAHKGTLFLDEIGDAPLPFQVKLLRVLQEHQIRRVGSNKIIPIDVRIIVATNHNLKEHIKLGLMREDLYYRLNVLPLKIPPLRKRSEDILALCYAFYHKYKPLANNAEQYFSQIRAYLQTYIWPGNIRELQNVVEYLTSICPDTIPSRDDLPEDLKMQLFSSENPKINLLEEVFAEIKRCNELHLPIGRRSLAQKFMVSESKIRQILAILLQEKRISTSLGKYGLQVID